MSTPTTNQYVKIGNRRIKLTESMQGKSPEELRGILLTTYPEIKTAKVRTKSEGDDTVVEFMAQPGRKG